MALCLLFSYGSLLAQGAIQQVAEAAHREKQQPARESEQQVPLASAQSEQEKETAREEAGPSAAEQPGAEPAVAARGLAVPAAGPSSERKVDDAEAAEAASAVCKIATEEAVAAAEPRRGGPDDVAVGAAVNAADDAADDGVHRPPAAQSTPDKVTKPTLTAAVSKGQAKGPNPRAICICLSGFKNGLPAYDLLCKAKLMAIARDMGMQVYEGANWSSQITHIIAPPGCRTFKVGQWRAISTRTRGGARARRPRPFLMAGRLLPQVLAGTLKGRWLMPSRWLLDSHANGGKLLPEGAYGCERES